jgi:hypothetical protein
VLCDVLGLCAAMAWQPGGSAAMDAPLLVMPCPAALWGRLRAVTFSDHFSFGQRMSIVGRQVGEHVRQLEGALEELGRNEKTLEGKIEKKKGELDRAEKRLATLQVSYLVCGGYLVWGASLGFCVHAFLTFHDHALLARLRC